MTTAEPLSFIAITITGATLLWQIVQFSVNKNTEAKSRQFEVYHQLIKGLVQGEGEGISVDRQCAAVFELRRFKHYRELTSRILEGLRHDWEGDRRFHPRLKNEITLALEHLNHR